LEAARRAVRRHWPLGLVLGIAAIPRIAAAIAYRPALFYSDSWVYVSMAYGPKHFDPTRPSGYSFALLVLGKVTHSLAAITTLQHLAGLALVALVYAVAIRMELGRGVAAGLAAVIGLDAWLIALEQTVLAETTFALLLAASLALLLVDDDERWRLVALSGVLLALACTVRTAGIFAIPFWLIYLAWRRGSARQVAIGLVAVTLPLLAYAAEYKHAQGVFGMGAANGWFTYGRVAQIADCERFTPPAGTRFLCESAAERRAHRPVYYLWNPSSPARRRFGDVTADRGANDTLRRFARAAIRSDPAAYAGVVASDVASYFVPGRSSPAASDAAITFPEQPRTDPPFMNTALRDTFEPGYDPAVHAPASAVRSYARVLHTPRWLLALAALASLAGLAGAVLRRRRGGFERAPEVLLFSGSALAILIGSTATSAFVVRYVVPIAPLLLIGGAVAAADLFEWRGLSRRSLPFGAGRRHGSPPRHPASSAPASETPSPS
jgi:hypothetical protein